LHKKSLRILTDSDRHRRRRQEGRMKTLLSGVVALTAIAALSAPAVAADLPVKARPAVPQVFDWTGCYVGVHVGGGWQISSYATQGAPASGAGVLGGGQAGCNYQWRQFVVGVEGEVWASSLDDRNQRITDAASDTRSRNRWDVALSLRSGWAIDNLYIYGKLGVVFGRFDYTQDESSPAFTTTERGRAVIPGVLIGFGFEYGLTPNWTAKFEYNYIDYGNQAVDFTNVNCNPACGTDTFSDTVREVKQLAKLGLNYKFGGSSPMSAMAAAWPAAASPMLRAFDWTGCYVGVHAGAGWQVSSFATQGGFGSGIGGLGGVQAGCNYQWRLFVIGIEGEVWGSSLYDRDLFADADSRVESSAYNSWDAAISARAGVAFDRAFLYGKLGGVWGRFDYDAPKVGPSSVSSTTGSADFLGVLIGAGFEYALTNNWTTKFEYNYIDYGTTLVTFNQLACDPLCAPFSFARTIKETKQIAKVGLNYKFGEPSGSMAAMAAALPVKAAAPAPQAFDWTGCYIGVHAGGGWQDASYANGTGLASGVGALGGGQAGCNYQFRQFVIGVEGEVWASSTRDFEEVHDGSFNRLAESRNVWDAALSVRSGVAIERAFIYGKLGVVWGRFEYSETFNSGPNLFTESGNAIYPGVLIGVGFEYALTDRWTAKFEYNYIDYGNRYVDFIHVNCNPAFCNTFTSSDVLKETKQLAKLGVNYKFGSSGAMSAMAAAIPVKAAPLPRIFDWTGCYIGVHAGAGWQVSSFTSDDTDSGAGVLGGGQAGCNYQWKQFVIGLEGEFWGSSLHDRAGNITEIPTIGAEASEANSRNRWDGAVSARAGFAFERTFVYGKLGGVWARFDYDTQSSFPGFSSTRSGSATFAGVLIGVGFEYALTENWTTKFEYNYIDYGHALVTFNGASCSLGTCDPFSFSQTIKETKQLAKLGVNYKFGR
jgi:outer membrane immunogenic protein